MAALHTECHAFVGGIKLKHIAIIDNSDFYNEWNDLISNSFTFTLAQDSNRLDENEFFDAVIISDAFAGANIVRIIRELKLDPKLKSRPIAVLTDNVSCENQNFLCSCGADDVIRLPLCHQLFVRGMNRLIDTSPTVCLSHESASGFDDLMNSVEDSDNGGRGAMCVSKTEFANIFSFVLRTIERTGQTAQMLLFTLSKSDAPDEAVDADIVRTLSDAVQICLRRGDMSSVFSRNQVLVLLTGADDDGGHLVANRIVSNFYSECDDDVFELQYDIREISRCRR